MNWRFLSTPYPFSYTAAVLGGVRDVVYMLLLTLAAGFILSVLR